MMRIMIDFFDKKTEIIAEDFILDVPENIVFQAAKSENVSYINSRPFDVSEELKDYIIKHYPHLEHYFKKYLYSFIGREGLPEDF